READLAAGLLDLPTQGPDDEREAIRPEVRPVLIDDRGLAVAIGHDFEDPTHVGPSSSAGELAVAEGAGTPLAEEVVRLGIDLPAGVERPDVGDPVLDRPPPFEDERPVAADRQEVGGEEPGRPGADDD